MKAEIEERAERAIAEKFFPGCVIAVTQKDPGNSHFKRTIIPCGTLIYHSEIPVAENTVYDLASITKSIPLASLALTFFGEGKLRLDDKVTKFIPELRNDFGATIEDLLRYRVHGLRMSTLPCKAPEEIEHCIFEHGFDAPPGESVYTNLPAFLLGIVLERVGSDTIEHLARKYFFDPLNMRDTFFPTATIEKDRPIYRSIAPTEVIEGKEIRGIVHDESARVFAKAGRAVGHAGLFSTAPDLVTFLEFLLTDRHRGRASVTGAQRGLGWEVQTKWMGKYAGAKTFGKTGFTGTNILCDVERGIGLVILSNRTYPHRPADSSAIHSFRADIAELVLDT